MPRGVLREMLAEFFGTFILIVFGVGVVAQVVLSKNSAGTFLSINIAWGLAVAMGCYVSAGVTGGAPKPAGGPGPGGRPALSRDKGAPRPRPPDARARVGGGGGVLHLPECR